VLPFYT